MKNTRALLFLYNNGNHLPVMLMAKALKNPNKLLGLTFQDCQTSIDLNGGLVALLNVADETNQNVGGEMNQNLMVAQKELMLINSSANSSSASQEESPA
jgi:hypothetical protein